MSIENIVKNIENNIQRRYGAEKVLKALEMITRMPKTFEKLVDRSFFATCDECDEGCDDCNEPLIEQLPLKAPRPSLGLKSV